MRILKGPIPPSVFGAASRKDDDGTSEPVKAKRKCGRPRNPIPRHKRESHINAEHRRRGKIQNGFRTLKSMVPKYEHASGRDSKADILFKAVDHCKVLKREMEEITSTMQSIQSEKEAIQKEIHNYQNMIPNIHEMTKTMDDRFDEYVEEQSHNGWAAWTLQQIVRPLFDSYKSRVTSTSLGDFLLSVNQWADSSLDVNNIRHLVVSSLQNFTRKTQLDSPVDIESERFATLSGVAHVPMQFSEGATQNLAFSNSVSHSSASPHTRSPHTLPSFSPQPPCAQSYSPHNPSTHSFSPHSPSANGYSPYAHTYSPENPSIQVCDSGLSSSAGIIDASSDITCFDGDHRDLASLSPRIGLQHSGELMPFPESETQSHLCHNINNNSIFADLNLSSEQSSSVNYIRSNDNNFDVWQQQEQQQYQNYSTYLEGDQHPHQFENDENDPTFYEMNKMQIPWSSSHFLTSDLEQAQALQTTEYNMFERDNKYDSPVSQEASPSVAQLDSAQMFSQRVRHIAESQRHKSASLSSTESDVGVLGMTSFSRQAAEVLQDQERYCPLTPSTDGCSSPVESSHLDSPFVKFDRFSHELPLQDVSREIRPHGKFSFGDHIFRTGLSNDHLPAPLPSYNDTFGPRENEYCKQKGSSVDGPCIKADTAPIKKLKHLETSSLLAELLGPPKFFKSNTARDAQKEIRSGFDSTGSSPTQQWPATDCLSEVNGRTLLRLPPTDNEMKRRPPLVINRNTQSNNAVHFTNSTPDVSDRFDNVRSVTNRNSINILDSLSKLRGTPEELSFEVAHQILLQSYGMTSDSCGKSHEGHKSCETFSRQRSSFFDPCSPAPEAVPVSHSSHPSDFACPISTTNTITSSRANSEKRTVSRKISFEDSYAYDNNLDRLEDSKKYCQWSCLDTPFENTKVDGLQALYCSPESASMRNEGHELKPVVNHV
ncbi:uncharacterized protein LOC106073420 isoform X3 [Biomphalaria glabrata]|uniref:Uncharacterized protein LOC106073420 isoform X3 n=1 Tax=Biomphalaria glabrata TaxID=6526 RepID=A0A9U8EJ80_BIOGL|nr:uncharacterized protein LOC106073420 isoform X3 [Biomphalaria glabrata]XP_055887830.1 uncharacterized protein LOC106073420 isoform X3 [Biomphalaria glabrata]